jgi:hypothetical protein
MPGAGVGGGQDNDALTAARFSLSIDTHLLMSSLQRAGVSAAGARQFSEGQNVTNATDRVLLARVLSALLKR